MKKILVVLSVILLASMACSNDLSQFFGPVAATVPPDVPPLLELVPTQAILPGAPTQVVAPQQGSVCEGPAILQTVWENQAVVIKIDTGESWTWFSPGICFGDAYFHGDQGFLNNRFPTHVGEFRAQYADGLALEVEGDDLIPYQSAIVMPATEPAAPAVGTEVGEAIVPNTVAWHQDTNHDTWEASPVGQLGSDLWILAEAWGPVNGSTQSYVLLVPPGAVMWIQRHFGGTGWWLASDIDPEERAQSHADGLEARDGIRPTIVLMPEDSFPLLGCLQSQPVENDIRHCDSVDGFSAFNVSTGQPFPGYFPAAAVSGPTPTP